MWQGISNTIMSVDFISEKPQILLNRSVRSKTIYGGLLSMIPITCITVSTIVFLYQMFSRSNSSLTYNKVPMSNVSFDYGQFPFMVALLDNGLKLINEEDRYYYFYSDLWEFFPNNSTGSVIMDLKRVPIKTEKCDIDKHFGQYREYFKDVPYLTHHYCAVPGQNITLYGIYGSIQPYNFLDFWISTCVNDTSVNRTNCYSREQSQARLVNTYISYQYLDYFIDHSDIQTPGKLILRSQILPVSSTIYKRDFFYIRNVNYYTDFDYIFSHSKLQNYSQVSSYKETSDLRPQGTVPGSFALISVMMDSELDQYERRFTKFQEVLANLGGLFKGLCLIAFLFNYILFDEIYYMNIMSGIFKPESKRQEEEKREKTMNLADYNNILKRQKCTRGPLDTKNPSETILVGTSMFKLKSLKDGQHPNSSINLMNLNDSNPNSNISSINNNILKKKKDKVIDIGYSPPQPKKIIKQPNDIELSFMDLICARFIKKKNKFKTYAMAKAYVENHLCIKNILNKLFEINKLKCFVFNKEQLALFNSLKNPSYYNIIEDNKDIWEGLVLSDDVYNEKELIEKFKAKENLSDIEHNFINMIKLYE